MKRLFFLLLLALALTCLFCACDNGEDIGVTGVEINEKGEAVVTLTDGTTHNAGVPTHNHTFGSFVDYSADNATVSCTKRVFYRTCTGCGDVEWRTGGDHTFETATTPATCTQTGAQTKTCSACGHVATTTLAIIPHSYQSTYSYSGSHHWHKCANCDAVTDKAEHTEGENALCTTCGEPAGPTEGVTYLVNGDHAEVLGYTGTATKVVIADTYEGKPVTLIANNAFAGKSITSVYVPADVETIDDNAFYDSSLAEITFASGSRLKRINYEAFYLTDLTSIEIPAGVTYIGSCALDVYGLHSIYITDLAAWCTMEKYSMPRDYSLYLNNTLITDLVIPDTVTSISANAFIKNNGLKSVTIPAGVKTINGSAFSYCNNLETVTFAPDSRLEKIDSYAFGGCPSLTSITIPATTNSIKSNAFDECPNLTEIIFLSKTGWKAGSTAIDSTHLQDTALAATYLTATYVGSSWTRTDPQA